MEAKETAAEKERGMTPRGETGPTPRSSVEGRDRSPHLPSLQSGLGWAEARGRRGAEGARRARHAQVLQCACHPPHHTVPLCLSVSLLSASPKNPHLGCWRRKETGAVCVRAHPPFEPGAASIVPYRRAICTRSALHNARQSPVTVTENNNTNNNTATSPSISPPWTSGARQR